MPAPNSRGILHGGPMSVRSILSVLLAASAVAIAQEPPPAIDPLVKASAYGDKTVWSYHDSKPVPWSRFRPKDYGGTTVPFNGTGVRPVGRVPAPGVHPRVFFSPEDLPTIRRRIKEDVAAQAAWKNIRAWSHALKLTYDEKADYAQPDWANGGFHVHGRFTDLMRIGGYDRKREDYFAILAAGGTTKRFEKDSPAGFFRAATTEALRCLVEDDAAGAQVLAKAVITAMRQEQARRTANDKPVGPGEPPRPSTARTDACGLGLVYDFIFNHLTSEQKQAIHDELVTLSAWADNYGTFNNAEASRSNWATFSYWVFDLMAIEGEPGFNDLKFLGLYRGWRNFYTYSFFDSGAAFEGEGKLLFGLDAAVAFDRVGWKYGLEPLTWHPLPRSYYGRFSTYAMLPTRDAFAVFDILGGINGGFTTPHDLVVAKWLYPGDRTTDLVYRAMVRDDYRSLPYSQHHLSLQAIISAIFATAYDPANTPEKLAQPLTFFCGQRALMMTRSSWDRDAAFLTMHERGASGGHPYPDRGGIMFAAQGRPWITIPGKDAGSWATSTVVIDGAGQNPTTPGRVVDHVDTPLATFTTGDNAYCWNWVWTSASRTPGKDARPITAADVEAGQVDLRNAWTLVDQCFNDFAYTASPHPVYQRPLKLAASWIGIDGQLTPMMRQVNTPVLHSFRSAGLVRGTRPWVLVVDDVQRDALPARYDWNLTLMPDLVRVDNSKVSAIAGDLVLAGKDSLDATGAPKAGEPLLLVRALDVAGRRLPDSIGPREKINLLTIATIAPSPAFKVLIHACRMGEPLPTTAWDAGHRTITVSFPGQKDEVVCTPAANGRTELTIRRDGRTLAELRKPVPPLADPASDALVERQRQVGTRLAALRSKGFDPVKLPGFAAGWTLDGEPLKPMAGSDATAQPIPLAEGAAVVTDADGRKSIAVAKAPLAVALEPKLIPPGPISIAAWVKTRPNPWMGRLVEVPGVTNLGFLQGGLRVGMPTANWSSAMLSSWTHLCVTWDGTTAIGYRNGVALSRETTTRKVALGKVINLGGADSYGNADVQVRDLLLFRSALDKTAVEDLNLWGRRP